MVDALKEVWRVLIPGGLLLDWRDLPEDWPVEIVAGSRVQCAGSKDSSSRISKHAAADASLAQVVQQGLFACESRHSLDCAWYWDTLDEMEERAEEPGAPEWRLNPSLPEEIQAQARRLMAESPEDAVVRVRINMAISQYRKQR